MSPIRLPFSWKDYSCGTEFIATEKAYPNAIGRRRVTRFDDSSIWMLRTRRLIDHRVGFSYAPHAAK